MIVTRPVFGGTAHENLKIAAMPAVISIRGGSFPAPETIPEIEKLEGTADVKTKILDKIEEGGEDVNIEDASVVVSGGRGMGTEEDFQLCAQLADVLGGVVGATRPVIESGWISRTHQVGQSGKIVTPDLYIAAGISGATQHLSGMTGSKYIIAINKDEDAAIFSVADIGIVGDAKAILPLMIEEVKKRKPDTGIVALSWKCNIFGEGMVLKRYSFSGDIQLKQLENVIYFNCQIIITSQ